MASVFLMFVKGKDHQSGLYLVPGENGRGFKRTAQSGLGYLVVLADVDGLDAAQARKQPLPVSGPDTNRDWRYRCEPVLHE